jgi:hypothetical protein
LPYAGLGPVPTCKSMYLRPEGVCWTVTGSSVATAMDGAAVKLVVVVASSKADDDAPIHCRRDSVESKWALLSSSSSKRTELCNDAQDGVLLVACLDSLLLFCREEEWWSNNTSPQLPPPWCFIVGRCPTSGVSGVEKASHTSGPPIMIHSKQKAPKSHRRPNPARGRRRSMVATIIMNINTARLGYIALLWRCAHQSRSQWWCHADHNFYDHIGTVYVLVES